MTRRGPWLADEKLAAKGQAACSGGDQCEGSTNGLGGAMRLTPQAVPNISLATEANP